MWLLLIDKITSVSSLSITSFDQFFFKKEKEKKRTLGSA
uniref:Uncharacterized protein n=1 Tax=Arundo donax TaxID=35708 RepID=A0A0A9DZQ8_ARUDO